jgi:Ca2+-binding EF-hand superfamily protein
MKNLLFIALFVPIVAFAQAPASDMPDMGQVFLQQLDADKDGKVTQAEFRAPRDKTFSIMDTNKDGVVDADEARDFSRMMMQRMQQMQQQMINMQSILWGRLA